MQRPRNATALPIIAAVTVALLAARAWIYVTSHAPPVAYARDLGFDYAVTAYMRHLVHSPLDFLDVMGWNAWYDIPQFFYNPLFEWATLAPIAALFHNLWTAIKVLQVSMIVAAGGGAYIVARAVGRARRWALIAGLVYALMPLVSLNLRAGFSVVWPGVLLPWSLVASIVLIRRFRERALPACALACALCGTVPHVEFLFVVSVPAYVLLVAYAFDRTTRFGAWFAYALAGLPFLVAPSLYMILPSLFQSSLSASATRAAAITFPGYLTLFSQTTLATLALAPREQLIDPSGLTNSAGFLYLAMPGGLLSWWLAYRGTRAAFAGRVRIAAWTAATVGIALALLAFGPNLGVGIPLWWILGHLPLLDALRTPDRFLTIPALFVALAAADGLRTLALAETRRAWMPPVVVAVLLASFLAFGARSHVWHVENDVAHIEPHLATVNALVAKQGYRTASYAVARGGAFDDGDGYGVPTPQIFSTRAFGARYGTDGIGGIGLLARDGTATVVTTPDWQRGIERYAPNFTTIFRAIPLGRTLFDAPDGVYVKALPHVDPMIAAARLSCLRGGPGTLDYLLALPQTRDTDLVAPTARCSSVTYSNYSPYDALTPQDSELWISGAALCPRCERLTDVDATYFVGRYELAQPWYRHAIDGDTPTFGRRGAALLLAVGGDRRFTIHLPAARERSALAMRYAFHGYGRIELRFPGGASRIVRMLPSHGLRWLVVPLPKPCRAGCTLRLTVRLAPLGIDDMGYTWSGIALDGLAMASDATLHGLERDAPRGNVILTSDAFTQARDQHFHQTPLRPNVAWTGHPTNVVIVARAPRAARDTLAIVVAHSRIGNAAPSSFVPESPRDASAFALRRLRRGWSVAATGAPYATLSAIAIEPYLPFYESQPGKHSADLVFTDGPSSLAFVRQLHGFTARAFSARGIRGENGSWLRARIHGDAAPTLYAVGAEGVTGKGSIQTALVCGKQTATQIATSSSGDTILTLTSAAPSCDLYAKWTGAATLSRIYVRAKRIGTASRTRTIWLPAGLYHIVAKLTNWQASAVAPDFRLDGRRVAGGTLRVARTGFHRLRERFVSGSSSFVYVEPIAPRAVRGLPPLRVRSLGTLRERVTVAARTSLKVNHLDDGYWRLVGAGTTLSGTPCNLVATCFPGVPAGRYDLVHRWPTALKIGMLLSWLSIVVALLPLLAPTSQRQRKDSSRP